MPEPTTLYQNYPDLKRLRKAVQRAGDAFALFFVECNLPSLRDELADALAADMLPPPVRVDISLLMGGTLALDELIALQVKDTPAPVFLFGLEQWLPILSEDKLRSTVQQLNWRRNRYASLQRPLVIWLPRYALNILAEQTPDFYDWYSGVFVFQASAELQMQTEGRSLQTLWSDSQVHAADRLSHEEKTRWLHTLRELLQGHAQEDMGRTNLLNNLAYLIYSLGDNLQALEYYQQSLLISREIGDKSGEGATLNNMATIAHARGDYATALDYLEKSLAIQQEIGDAAGMCATLFNMGHIHRQNAEQDESMRLWVKAYGIAKQLNLAQVLDALGNLAEELDLPGGLAGWDALAEKIRDE